MSRLIHYSAKPLERIWSITIDDQKVFRNGVHKPRGLWVSVEGEQDWKEWCEAENWGLNRLACAAEIILAPQANVLHLSSETDLDRFHKEFATVLFRYGKGLGEYTAIQWPVVAAKYDGVIIAPYIWSRRRGGAVSDWYCGWDCASGCIWNVDAIADFKLIEQQEAA